MGIDQLLLGVLVAVMLVNAVLFAAILWRARPGLAANSIVGGGGDGSSGKGKRRVLVTAGGTPTSGGDMPSTAPSGRPLGDGLPPELAAIVGHPAPVVPVEEPETDPRLAASGRDDPPAAPPSSTVPELAPPSRAVHEYELPREREGSRALEAELPPTILARLPASARVGPSLTLDELTGLEGPDAWSRILEIENSRLLRYRRPVTVVIAELEGMRRLAERLGDEPLERLLPVVGDAFRKEARGSDWVARIGDGRFAILLAETDEIQAINYVERVRLSCEPWLASAAVPMRLAIGWSSPPASGDMEFAVRRAEERMNADRRVPGKPNLPSRAMTTRVMSLATANGVSDLNAGSPEAVTPGAARSGAITPAPAAASAPGAAPIAATTPLAEGPGPGGPAGGHDGQSPAAGRDGRNGAADGRSTSGGGATADPSGPIRPAGATPHAAPDDGHRGRRGRGESGGPGGQVAR